MGSLRQSADRETGPGAHAFIRVHKWSALGFCAKARLVNSNQEWAFGELLGSLI